MNKYLNSNTGAVHRFGVLGIRYAAVYEATRSYLLRHPDRRGKDVEQLVALWREKPSSVSHHYR